ncbi:unnamed protein product [Alternaria alternata]
MKYRTSRSHGTPGKTPKRPPPKSYASRKYTDRSFDETTAEINNQRNFWDSFLGDNETTTPCRSTEVIRDFCETERQTTAAHLQPEIHLDDRDHKNDESRDCPHPLTIDKLRHQLRLERFGLEGQPDADYRRISIRNINPDSIFVLAQTAAHHQRDTLRDAVSKHLDCKTSFRIHERADGFVTPRLELHLPYLMLREVFHESNEWKAREPGEEGESWLDMPLPMSKAKREDRPDRFLIKKSHTSIVLCVWDYSKWVGYGFFRGGPVGADDEVDGEGDSEACGEGDSDGVYNGADEGVEENEPVPRKEIFAPDDDSHDMYSDTLIHDPRRYFLRITGVWMRFVVREYTYLVGQLEAYVEAWQKNDRQRSLNVSNKGPQEDVMILFDRIMKRKQLLCHVREHISTLVQEWNDFNGPNGYIRCLGDIKISQRRVLLKDINASVVDLIGSEQKLTRLITSCEKLTGDLTIRMGFESIKLQSDAYALNRESNGLQRRAYRVNFETQLISRRTTEAAENTSHTTRTNILVRSHWVLVVIRH